jgi:hypothetical protein
VVREVNDFVPIEHQSTRTSIVDVLDHVMDKGIVIDAWARYAMFGIDLMGADARVIVASIQTFPQSADAIGERAPASTALDLHRTFESVNRVGSGAKRDVES